MDIAYLLFLSLILGIAAGYGALFSLPNLQRIWKIREIFPVWTAFFVAVGLGVGPGVWLISRYLQLGRFNAVVWLLASVGYLGAFVKYYWERRKAPMLKAIMDQRETYEGCLKAESDAEKIVLALILSENGIPVEKGFLTNDLIIDGLIELDGIAKFNSREYESDDFIQNISDQFSITRAEALYAIHTAIAKFDRLLGFGKPGTA